MLETYVLFWPPTSGDFNAYTTQQSKESKRWFMDNIPVRLAELRRIVRLNGGEAIPWDFTIDSLVELCRWLAPRMTLMPCSPELQEEVHATLPEWLHDKIPIEVMSNETFSLCAYIGLFFAETLRTACPALHWEQVKRPKSSANLNHRVLAGFLTRSEFNPLHVMTVIAERIREGADQPDRTRDAFHVWFAYCQEYKTTAES